MILFSLQELNRAALSTMNIKMNYKVGNDIIKCSLYKLSYLLTVSSTSTNI